MPGQQVAGVDGAGGQREEADEEREATRSGRARSGKRADIPWAVIAATRWSETGVFRRNSSESMQGRARPMKLHSIQTATWSRTMWRNQPFQRSASSGVMGKTMPTCDSSIDRPPMALGIAPILAPMPQPLSRA